MADDQESDQKEEEESSSDKSNHDQELEEESSSDESNHVKEEEEEKWDQLTMGEKLAKMREIKLQQQEREEEEEEMSDEEEEKFDQPNQKRRLSTQEYEEEDEYETTTIKKKKRRKDRPRLMNSKRPVSHIRHDLFSTNQSSSNMKKEYRDPRFDSLSTKAFNSQIFDTNYGLVVDQVQGEELRSLKHLFSKTKNDSTKSRLESQIAQLTQRIVEREREQQFQAKMTSIKREETQKVREHGKKPFYLKRSKIKEMRKDIQFEDLKNRKKLGKYMQKKKKKKQLQNEHHLKNLTKRSSSYNKKKRKIRSSSNSSSNKLIKSHYGPS